MSFSIKMPVVFSARSSPITTCRNYDFDTERSDSLDKRLRIITFVGNQTIKAQVFNQVVRLPVVALLAARQNKTNRVSKRVNRQMDFRRKTAARTP